MRAIASADLVVLVLNATQLLTENEHGLAVDWMSQAGQAGRPGPQLDERRRGPRPGRVATVARPLGSREHLGGELGRHWFEVNAKGALMHVVGGGPAPTTSSPSARLYPGDRGTAAAGCRPTAAAASSGPTWPKLVVPISTSSTGSDGAPTGSRQREAARCDLPTAERSVRRRRQAQSANR